MGSGAYAVFIDQQAPGGGPPGSLRRVVPLPPPELSGGVKFTTVVLSLAYDNFGEAGAPATIPATVRVLRVCPKTSGGITKFSEHEAD